jgi:hypothetical protein
MRRSAPAVLTGLTMLAFITACSNSETGTPTPGTAAATTESTSTKPSSARPREIKLDGKDPCQLLTSAQLAELKFDHPGKPEDAPAYKAKGCVWAISGPDARVLPVTSEGIEAWSSGKRTGQPEKITPIAGFPAITVTRPSDQRRCDLMVDTAEGQYLMVTYSLTPGFEDRFPKPGDGAQQIAEAAMQNLAN